MDQNYIKVTEDAGKHFFSQPDDGPIVMLNLLRFREIADYKLSPELKPASEITGEQAYGLYMEKVSPLLSKIKSELIFIGTAEHFLIGPQNEKWDLVLLVKHNNKTDFLSFASDPDYQKIEGHRTAALLDSRLLPIKEGLKK